MADDELEHIRDLYSIKKQRLRVLERQIGQFGEQYAPAHLIIERGEVKEAVAKYETVLGSNIPADVGDNLGATGRFVLTMEEFRSLRDMVALHGYQLGEFIAETVEHRKVHAAEHAKDRKWQIAAAIALVIIAAFVLGRSF